MLGLSRSISNRIVSVSENTELEDVVYTLGDDGELSGAFAYLYSFDSEGEPILYEVHPDAFFHADATTWDASTTFLQLKADVEGESYGTSVSNWEVVSSNLEFIPSSGYLTSSNLSESLDHASENWMTANFFVADACFPSNLSQILSDISIGSSDYAENTTFMVVFKNGSTDSYFSITKSINLGSIQDLLQLHSTQGWTEQNNIQDSLGTLIHATDSEGKYVNYVIVANHRPITGDFSIPLVTPIPTASVNVYSTDSLIPNGIDFGVLSAFGDVLDPNRLVDASIDRYVKSDSIKNEQDYPGFEVPFNEDSAISSGISSNSVSIPSISTQNMQVTIKVIFHSQEKPPAPWYDSEVGEVLKAKIEVLGYRNSSGVGSLNESLTVYGDDNFITVNEGVRVVEQIPIAGTAMYFSLRTFVFDLSAVPVYATAAEKTALGVVGHATVSDLAYDSVNIAGVQKHKAQIFEVKSISFGSNKRGFSPSVSGVYKTFKEIIVPTTNLHVGANVEGVMVDLSTSPTPVSVMHNSTKVGFTPPYLENSQFLWEFSASSSENKSITTSNSEKALNFDSRAGAINENSVFVYINGSDQQTEISGDVTISIDESLYPSDPNIAIDLKYKLNDVEYALDDAPTISLSGTVRTYNWDYVKTFLLTGGGAQLEVKEEVTLVAKIVNGSRPNGDYNIELIAGSTFVGVEDTVDYGSTVLPSTDPEDLSGQTIKPVPKYNKY